MRMYKKISIGLILCAVLQPNIRILRGIWMKNM